MRTRPGLLLGLVLGLTSACTDPVAPELLLGGSWQGSVAGSQAAKDYYSEAWEAAGFAHEATIRLFFPQALFRADTTLRIAGEYSLEGRFSSGGHSPREFRDSGTVFVDYDGQEISDRIGEPAKSVPIRLTIEAHSPPFLYSLYAAGLWDREYETLTVSGQVNLWPTGCGGGFEPTVRCSGFAGYYATIVFQRM